MYLDSEEVQQHSYNYTKESKEGGEDKEDFFDELQFLSLRGVYSPVQMRSREEIEEIGGTAGGDRVDEEMEIERVARI